MQSNDFAVFILSHGRADTISTYRALRDSGYTGRTYVVIDNEDDQEDLYRQKFGDDIIQFDKRDYLEKTDLGDLDTDRRIGVKELADRDGLITVGRLAEYRYYNMDSAIESALKAVKEICERQ